MLLSWWCALALGQIVADRGVAAPPARVAAEPKPAAWRLPDRDEGEALRWQRAGFTVEELREDLTLRTAEGADRPLPAGTWLVRRAPGVEDYARAANAEAIPKGVPLLTSPLPPLDRPPGTKRFTFAEVTDGERVRRFDNPPPELVWRPDGVSYLQQKDGRTWLVSARTGAAQRADDAKLATVLAQLPTLTPEASAGPRRVYNAQRTAFVFVHEDDLYYAKLDGSEAARLTSDAGKEELPEFSPDGRFLAFVRSHDLHIVDLATKTVKRLTEDGSGTVRSGLADWIYYEEIYDRKRKAFWWSPDSRKLAFLRFDDTAVPTFTLTDDRGAAQKLEQERYPKPGDPNPKVRLGVAGVGGTVRWVDALPDAESPLLCSRVGWTPRGELWFTTQDRAQTWLELHRCDTALKPALLFRDATKAWVEPEVEPHYLPDGTFVWAREPEGYRHLHLHAADGKLLRALTTGEWEVRKVRRLEAGFVYFTANKDNPISEQLYRAKLDGTGMERVTDGKGDRRAADLAPGGQFVVDVFSAPDHPTRSVLCSPAGRAIRTLDANPVPERRDFDFAGPEFLKIKLADGYTLDGILVPPAKLEAGQRYPVHTKIYGGPRMPQVRQEWAGGRGDERMLAELGIATFIVDPRSASGHSAKAAWSAYRKLGQQEAKDLAEAVAWLAQQKPWIDPQRVGLEGFSYGGYLTAYCLTHTKAFAAGVAGSGPMDWRRYDSIYTERYMGLPAENRVGYDQGSVLLAAANLHGKLLVCHGMLDDNVHPENSLRLLLELQKAGKPCEAMLYPGARHENFGRHFRELRLDFLKRTLGGPRPTA